MMNTSFRLTQEEWDDWRHSPMTEWFFDEFLKAECRCARQTAMRLRWQDALFDDAEYRQRVSVISSIGFLWFSDIVAARETQKEEDEIWRRMNRE